MKVIEGDQTEDRHGRYPIIFKNASIREINDYLWTHYQGYRFLIQFDTTHEEYEEVKDAHVYFADELLDELAYFYDKKLVKLDRTAKETPV